MSRASERLLTTDWLPLSAFSNKARLLILLEEDNCTTVPDTFDVFEMERYDAKGACVKLVLKVIFIGRFFKTLETF